MYCGGANRMPVVLNRISAMLKFDTNINCTSLLSQEYFRTTMLTGMKGEPPLDDTYGRFWECPSFNNQAMVTARSVFRVLFHVYYSLVVSC
jgi:hypothetical protein